jgi:hypothetical protein
MINAIKVVRHFCWCLCVRVCECDREIECVCVCVRERERQTDRQTDWIWNLKYNVSVFQFSNLKPKAVPDISCLLFGWFNRNCFQINNGSYWNDKQRRLNIANLLNLTCEAKWFKTLLRCAFIVVEKVVWLSWLNARFRCYGTRFKS